MAKPSWTKYNDEEWVQRAQIVTQYVGMILMAHRREGRDALGGEVLSWMYALEVVPTHRLVECFGIATANHTSEYTLTAGEVKEAYEEVKQQMLYRQQEVREKLLTGPGADGSGRMFIDDFRRLHSLPQEWKLGDPYPPESDLYNKPVPGSMKLYRCFRCKDAGWTRVPYNSDTGEEARMVQCECDQSWRR